MIQPYDILMLVVLVGMAILGVWKGMAWQAAALASVVVSALAAVNVSPSIAPWFGEEEPWNRIIAMLIIYVIVAGAIWLLFRLISNIIDRVKLKEFDRQLGATFGIAKGILYCVIITFFAVTLSESSRQLVLQSHSGKFISKAIQRANPFIPDDIRAWLGKYIDELEQKLNEPPLEKTDAERVPPAEAKDEEAIEKKTDSGEPKPIGTPLESLLPSIN